MYFKNNQQENFERYPEEDLAKFVPKLDETGLDLLIVRLLLFIEQKIKNIRKCFKLILT